MCARWCPCCAAACMQESAARVCQRLLLAIVCEKCASGLILVGGPYPATTTAAALHCTLLQAHHEHDLLRLLIEADAVSEACIPLTVVEGAHLATGKAQRACVCVGVLLLAALRGAAVGVWPQQHVESC